MQTNTELATVLADTLGYDRSSNYDGIFAFVSSKPTKLLKGQHQPRIEAYRAMVRVFGPDWFVDFYNWQNPEGLSPNTVGITGNIEAADMAIRPALERLPQEMVDLYERKLAWSRQNPMYRKSATPKTQAKSKLNPSQLIA